MAMDTIGPPEWMIVVVFKLTAFLIIFFLYNEGYKIFSLIMMIYFVSVYIYMAICQEIQGVQWYHGHN